MSIIASVVKAALSLDQRVQGLVSKGATALASRNFGAGEKAEALALVNAEDTILKLERIRAKCAIDLIEAHKRAMINLHSTVDARIEMADARKVQDLRKAQQYKQSAALCQSISINAQVAAENALRAIAQLG